MPGAPPSKETNPLLEYQFSAVDPSTFGEGSSDLAGQPHVDVFQSVQLPFHTAREQIPITTNTHEPSSSKSETVSNHATVDIPVAPNNGLLPGWPEDLSGLRAFSEHSLYLPGTQSEVDIDVENDIMPDWPVDLSSLNTLPEYSLIPLGAQKGVTRDGRDAQHHLHRRSRPSLNQDSAQWKGLLRSYYRMGNPSPPKSLHTETSALVEHYFRDVCVIFSTFDSAMNPFRTVIARLWDNSSSIFFAIQSMAAAHLANYMPNMRVTGLNMQQKAYECLQQELQLASINRTMDDKLILAVLLLGLTACWHDSRDLGVAHLDAARALIYPRLLQDDPLQNAESKRNDQFFAEALIYWEMCMAFVSQETFVPGMERRLHAGPVEDAKSRSEEKVFPHPWTGISPRVQMLFAEVGRLVRHYCTMRYSLFDATMPPVLDMEAIITAVKDLEEELLSIDLPSEDELVDVQDKRTRGTDFINIAEATKCAALLEIYRVFPEILASRLGSSDPATDAGHEAATFFSFEANYTLGLDNESSSWLTSLATHILNLLESVPTSSGVRPLQLLLLMTAAAELRLKASTISSEDSSAAPEYDLEVAKARGFAMTRLNELASRLPSKPIVVIIQLVQEVWRRNDAGEDVFWMDVMTANGWETIMG